MDYWILLNDGKPITKSEMVNGVSTNHIPFSFEEAQKYKKLECVNSKLINISEDIRQHGIEVKENGPFEERQNIYQMWYNEFRENNIEGFSMPIKINTNDEYLTELKKLFEKYKKEVGKIAFKYEQGLVEDVANNCDIILKALEEYFNGYRDKAKDQIASLIKKYIKDPFWVSDLDKSYAFRGLAPFFELHSVDYEKQYACMMNNDIDFYRARTEKITKDRKEVLHIPYKKLHLITEQRFSLKGQPCLYLGTTSYVCWTECRKPELKNFYLAGFRANDFGKKLKIFNLVVSEGLVNGIYQKGCDERSFKKESQIKKELQISMLKLLPIVFATSFSIMNENREEKYEYIISQLLMQSLYELNIDGVAYLSKQGNDDFQYPQGVNLAIPVFDINDAKEYGDVCDKFVITEPNAFYEFMKNAKQKEETSYLNNAFSDCLSTKRYNEDNNQYSLVDNSIAGEKYDKYR